MELQETIKNLTTDITGKGNRLTIPESVKLQRVSVIIHGTGNVIEIGEVTNLRNLVIEIRGHNNKVKIGNYCKVQGHILLKGHRQKVKIGSKTTFQYNCSLLAAENKNITIGRDCMFSNTIEVRTTDEYSIIDVETGLRTNTAEDVVIGHHVWVSADALIAKGAVIPDNCIIGARSVVTDVFEEPNTTIAGAPAKVVSRGVTWDRKRINNEDLDIKDKEQQDSAVTLSPSESEHKTENVL